MVVILRGNDVVVEWRLAFSSEEFEYEAGRFYVYAGVKQTDAEYEIRDNVLYSTIPGNQLEAGLYSMVFAFTSYKCDELVLNKRKVSGAFVITEDEEEVVDGPVICDTSAYGRTLYSLLDVDSSSDNSSVNGAEEGNVLTFQNGLWRGMKPASSGSTGEGTDTELREYLDKLFQLRKDANGNEYINTPYSFASEKTVSSLGVGEGGEGGGGGASYLYQLADVESNGAEVAGAVEGYSLVFKNGKWQGVKVEADLTDVEGKIELITVTLEDHEARIEKVESSVGDTDKKIAANTQLITGLREYLNSLFAVVYKEDGTIDYVRTPHNFASDKTVSSLGVGGDGGAGSLGFSILQSWDDDSDASEVMALGSNLGRELYDSISVIKDENLKGISSRVDIIESELDSVSQTLTQHGTSIQNNRVSISDINERIVPIEKAFNEIKTWFTLEGDVLRTTHPLASDHTVSSLGVGSDNGGSGVSYDRLDNWDNYVEGDGSVLSSYLGYGLLERIIDLEEGTSGDYASIEEKVDKNTNAITALSTSLNDFLTGVNVDDTINRWKELEKFLEGYKETATLADLLKGKVDTEAYNTAINGINETLGIHTSAINSNATNIASINTALLNHDTRITNNAKAITEIEETLADWFTLEDGVLHSKYGLASDKTVSSLGVGSSEGGGVSYNRLDSWDSYTADKAGYVLSAALGWDLKTRLDNLDIGDFDLSGYLTKSEAENTYATIRSLNSGLARKQETITDLATIRANAALGATALQSSDLDGYVNEIATSGSGNAITSVTKSGKKLTFNKASSFFLAENFTKTNIKTMLGISDWALASSKPSYKTSEVTEEGNLYFTTDRVKNCLTGAISTVLTSNLTASRALISNASGKIAVSAVTSTELGYLDGVTSAVQTQLNALSARIKAYEDILKIEENNTLLHATVAFASDSTVSSLGVGSGDEGNIGGVIDLTNYYTKTQVHSYVSQELNTFSEENLGTALQNYFPLSGNKTITGKVTISSAGFLEVQGNVYVGGTLYSGLSKNNPYATQDWVESQGYTSNIGTVTGVRINGSTKNPSSGIVDLGYVASYEAIVDVVEDYLTYDYSLSSDTTDAVKLTTLSGRSQSITTATLKNSLGLKALAYKDSIDLSAYAKTSQLENYYTKDAADSAFAKVEEIETLVADEIGLYLPNNFSVASNTTNAVSVTIGSNTENISAATLKTSLGLGGAAYKAVGAVASGNTGLVTGGAVYTAIKNVSDIVTEINDNYASVDYVDSEIEILEGDLAAFITATEVDTKLQSYATKATTLAGYGITDGVLAGAKDLTNAALASYSGLQDWADNNPSFIGSLYDKTAWYNVISLRHRNGTSDGNAYGMLLYSQLTVKGASLKYIQQMGGTWDEKARTILDSSNFSDYALPLSGGELSGGLTVKGNVHLPNIYFNGTETERVLAPYTAYNYDLSYYDGAAWNRIIHSGNIGSQSVASADYATSADNATKWNGFKYYNEAADYSNTNPYFKLVTIRIKGEYVNSVVSFDVSGRSKGVAHIEVYPNGQASISNSGVARVEVTGNSLFADKIRAYTIGNETDSSGNIIAKVIEVWYTKQQQSYDGVVVQNVHWGQSESVEINCSKYAALPTSYESYVDATMGSIYGSITKLTTPRTIWGQSFDGSGDVSGDLRLNGSNIRGYNNYNLIEAGSGVVNIGYGYQYYGLPVRLWGSPISFAASGNYDMTIKSNGNVLIGTTTDNGHKLQVNGDSYVSGTLNIGNESSANITLHRNSANYIWAVNSGGYLVLGVQDVGVTGTQNASLMITGSSVTPGARNNAVSLGSANYRWSNIYSVNGNFSGSLTVSGGITMGGNTVATQTWVQNQGYATQTSVNNSLGSLSAEISAVDARIDALGTAAKKNWSGASSADTTNLVTIGWVESKLGGYATAASIPTKTSQLTNDSNFVSGCIETTVIGGGTGLVTGGAVYSFVEGSLSGYAKKATTLSGYGITDALPKSNPSVTGTLTVAGNVLPSANDTRALGSTNYRWSKLYANGVDCTGSISSTTNISAQGNVTAINGGLSGKTLSVSGAASVGSLTVGGAVHSNLNIGGYRIKTEGGDIYGVYDGLDKLMYFDASAAFCSAFVQTSDERLKNILNGDFRLSLGTMACAPLVQFDWNNRNDGKHHVGTIAQYWQGALPEVVSKTQNGTLALAYGELGVAMGISLANILEDTNGRVATVEEEIKTLKEENKRLKERVAELEAA